MSIIIKDNNLYTNKKLVYGNKPETIVILATEMQGSIEDLNNYYINNCHCDFFPFHFYIRTDGTIYKGRDTFFYVPRIYELFDGTLYENIFDTDYSIEVPNKNNVPSKLVNKVYILFEGNNGTYDCNDLQYNAIVQLCKELKKNFMSLNRIYAYSELYTEIKNPDLVYFKINEIRSRVNNIVLPVFSTTLNGKNIYSFGTRELYYKNINPLTGNDIELLQSLLISFNIRDTAPNGVYDLLTEKEVKIFQSNVGLEKTGVVSDPEYEQLSRLYNEFKYKTSEERLKEYRRIIKYDTEKGMLQMTGTDVLTINKKLVKFGLLTNDFINSDTYTYESFEAVKNFQVEYLKMRDPDGIIGPILYEKILTTTPKGWIHPDDKIFSLGDTDTVILFINEKLYSVAEIFSLSNINITSTFDIALKNNIIRMQTAFGIRVTGTLNKDLFEKIKSL